MEATLTKVHSSQAQASPRVRRLTTGEYFAMGEHGIIKPDERVELIHGHIVDRMAEGPLHAFLTSFLVRWFILTLNQVGLGDVIVRQDHPVLLGDQDAPEPDLVLLREEIGPSRHPRPDDILLVIEVAIATLASDRAVKAPLYAQAGIPEYWIVAPEEGTIEVYCDPKDGRYRSMQTLPRDQTLRTDALPNLGDIAVADLLPEPAA